MKSEQVTVHLDPATYAPIRRQAEEWETSESAVVRRIIKHWASIAATLLEEPFNADEWRWEKVAADYDQWLQWNIMRCNTTNRRAHIIVLNGRSLWVLPDDNTSGQKRSRTISEALAAIQGTQLDPLAYVAGRLLQVGADRIYFQEDE